MSENNKIKSFFNRHSSTYNDTPLTFAQLNIDKIKTRLNLSEGKERGKQNLPPQDSRVFDDIEQKIVLFIENEVRESVESYYDNERSFETRITQLNSLGYGGKVKAIAISAAADFKNHIHQTRDQLHTARLDVTSREMDKKAFKAKHKLDRSARYPHSKSIYFAVALFLLVIETFINGQFFAKGSELGMVGGFFTAFIPSLLNVALGYCLGNFVFRLCIHQNLPKRLVGIILSLFIPIVIFTLNLAVAHYRSAMVAMMENAPAFALTSFIQTPFILSDIESWLLVATGCLFSLVAAIDFWKSDDAYLYYGDVERDYQQKINEYADFKASVLNELAHVRDKSLNDLDEAYSNVTIRYNEANSIFDAQRRWSLLFQEHLKHLESVGRTLIAYYRNLNSASRTEAAPQHFLQEWHLEKPVLPASGVDFQRIIGEFQVESASAQHVYIDSAAAIGREYEIALDTYQTIEQLKPEETASCEKISTPDAPINTLETAQT